MAWIRWDLLFSLGLFMSPAFVSTDQSGFRRYYVLQPGPSGTDRVHVSSISSRSSATGQPHAYNVELTASYGSQVRTRRMGNQANPIPLRQDTQFTQHQQVIRQTSHNVHQSHQMKISGVNVCGGQCCHGWSKASGSQRCTKPNCLPQCQNGGMCLRPQLCVCKLGFNGKACEQKTKPTSSIPAQPGNGHTNGHTNGRSIVPRRPIPQQVPIPQQGYAPVPVSNMAQMTLTVKQSPHLVRPQQSRPGSQQFVLKPKYYNTHTTHSQTHVQHQPDRPIPLTGEHYPIHAGNHTGRIKVVFTPTICKVTCTGGRCQNNCELGNTTTIVSENGHAADTLTAPNFRVVVCHLPCMNGGKCSARDKCQCPATYTGRFCQMPVQNGNGQQRQKGQQQTSQIHSTHTLPLTFSNGQNPVKYAPSIVNIHVKHPPEASVQIHQVSQLDANGQKVKGNGQNGQSQTQSRYTYHHSDSRQNIQQQGHNIIYPNQQSYVPQYQPVSSKSQLGRCFQETTGTQCGKALPGLSKQEECCQSIGTSWGFHKCQKCPKPSIPLTAGGSRHAMDCPQGYKRINNSHCQDLNECQLQGVCPNGDCLNTMGSYRCSCKVGFIPDPTLSTCIPDTSAVHEEKGACFRLVSSGKQCLHPVSAQLSKQLCCCSVGKAWGPRCDKCPLPGTAKFKEICPGGMGYTVTGSYKPKPPNKLPSQPETINKPMITHQERVAPPLPLPTHEKPVEALSVAERQLPSVPVATDAPEQELVILEATSSSPIVEAEAGQPQLSPGVSTMRMEPAYKEVVEETSPPAPALILPTNAGQDIAPSQSAEVDECKVNPHICGQGLCYNSAEGYTCICNQGYQMDETHTTCVDVDECLDSASLCSNGRCKNTPGSFLCVCQAGFMTDEEGTSCIDLNECLNTHTCPEDDFCVNTVGFYTCLHCDSGYRMSPTGQCEDINECLDLGVCPSGLCINFPGSYECDLCPKGFQGQGGQCVDVDECLFPSTCANGRCSNFEGYFVCLCNDGFTLSLDGQSCEDVDECLDPSTCANGRCSNFEGYFVCLCNDGFTLSLDGQSCEDVDECQDEQVCTRGHCQNTEGSFLCNCGPGFRASAAGDQCDDVDECQELIVPCDGVGQCVNNMGSYHCRCPQGYQQINGTSCLDVDECLDDPELCSPHGECLNAEGSFYCVCERGFAASQDKHTCEDVDECLDGTRCVGGSCENSQGSYRCQCDTGYRLQADTDTCLDIDECSELGRSICGAWRCENTEGSYRCVVDCPPGHSHGPEGICMDIDECSANATACGIRGFCENTVGSFRCLCDRGYQESQEGLGCVDVNECDLLSGVCGEALCENVEGSFLCMCPDEDQEYNQMTAKCSPAPTASSVERKECYYNLNDENLCENVLTSSVTMEECCCTLGAGWGDNCEVHPCPVQGTDQFSQMCPAGRGSVPTGDTVFGVTAAESYKDADECALFGQEICKDGFCFNSPGSYECYCKNGLYYDEVKLQCRDIDECQEESSCVEGECLNTQGSYMCFCTHPLVLDSDNKSCVIAPEVAEQHGEQTGYQGVCWQTVTDNLTDTLTDTLTCTKPLANRKTTYTECCCLFGEAWGMDCTLCPLKNTEDYASMCNVAMSGGQGRPYGRDALVAGPVQEYEVSLDYEPHPDQPGALPLYEDEENLSDAFEGLRAEECGILNGCENGRCVRVQEGYTCDCFDGYTLDMSRMACLDVNECSELNNRMSLCKNSKCINTQGSYKCVCLPGYTPSERPNYCVAREQGEAAAATERE
ncbi:latent-transforming growth factor beta-binding protein 1 isoform X1 [Salmo trutta]|uniref:Latent-transforming growth factor beta-binding protein 1 n=1 Tax=Salmo trutta TaxID=8032 RepID=A0A673VWC4_SALTR|nr:latent-transforming growth factor beta-binding protein 1-like isoform X1 [Salmo trutta]